MELDHLKNLWNKEEVSETPEISLEKQKEIHSPLEKIKSGMRMEFWMNVFFVPLLFIGLYSLIEKSFNVLFTCSLIVLLTCVISGYYTLRFYKLYKKISLPSYSTNYQLFALKTELCIMKELYKSYYVAFVPLMFAFFLTMMKFNLEYYSHVFIFIISFGFGVGLMYIVGKLWLKEMYGKYINEIVYLVDELNGIEISDEIKIKNSKKIAVFEKTQTYFEKYFGKYATIINMSLWTVVILGVLLGVSYLVGYGIGYTATRLNILDNS